MTDNWKNSAACADVGGDVWFPTAGNSPREAIRICNECPVKAMCLAAGMNEEFGVWGGTTPAQRGYLRPEPIPRQHYDPAQIITAHERGMPAAEIAAHVGCTQRTVHRVLKAEREKAA